MSNSDSKPIDSETIEKTIKNIDAIKYFIDHAGKNEDLVNIFGEIESSMKELNKALEQPLCKLTEQFLMPKFETSLKDLENDLQLHELNLQHIKLMNFDYERILLNDRYISSIKQKHEYIEEENKIIWNTVPLAVLQFQEKLETLNVRTKKAVENPEHCFEFLMFCGSYNYVRKNIEHFMNRLWEAFEVDGIRAKQLFDRSNDMRLDLMKFRNEVTSLMKIVVTDNNPEFVGNKKEKMMETMSQEYVEVEIMWNLSYAFLKNLYEYSETENPVELSRIQEMLVALSDECQRWMAVNTNSTIFSSFLAKCIERCCFLIEEMFFDPEEPSTSQH